MSPIAVIAQLPTAAGDAASAADLMFGAAPFVGQVCVAGVDSVCVDGCVQVDAWQLWPGLRHTGGRCSTPNGESDFVKSANIGHVAALQLHKMCKPDQLSFVHMPNFAVC
jgi:hypothetical protein